MLRATHHGPMAGRQRGVSLMEVLVSVVIVIIGLLGLAGLQSHATLAEMESFQRGQALVLLNDMVDRINANRARASDFVTPSPVGADNGYLDCSSLNGPAKDVCEWNNSLAGAAEANTAGTKVGAMIGARGCVQQITAVMPRQYLVSVVWQGLVPTKAPAQTSCGQNLYGDDKTRRAIVTSVTIACLRNNPVTAQCMFPMSP